MRRQNIRHGFHVLYAFTVKQEGTALVVQFHLVDASLLNEFLVQENVITVVTLHILMASIKRTQIHVEQITRTVDIESSRWNSETLIGIAESIIGIDGTGEREEHILCTHFLLYTQDEIADAAVQCLVMVVIIVYCQDVAHVICSQQMGVNALESQFGNRVIIVGRIE